MFDEIFLIDLIKSANPTYTVEYARDSDIDNIHKVVIQPLVYVGHVGIKRQFPEDFIADGYHELDNSEILITTIQFLCKRAALVETRANIKRAYEKQSPFPNDSNYSSIVFMEASVVAKTGVNVWWQEIVGTVMPRIS